MIDGNALVMREDSLSSFKMRCTAKLTHATMNELADDYVSTLEAFFKHVRKAVDKKLILLPLLSRDKNVSPLIGSLS